MSKTFEQKIEEYVKLEKEIIKELDKRLDKNGIECDCEDRDVLKFVFEGEFDEIHTRCVNCGGYVNE